MSDSVLRKRKEAEEYREALAQLEAIEQELDKRTLGNDPTNYGYPDLLFPQNPGETDEEFRLRREAAVKDVVENHMKLFKGGDFHNIKLIPQMLEFLTDLFYGYVNKAIVVKARGGGGTFTTGVLAWLLANYKKQTANVLSTSKDQSRIMYDYIKGFFVSAPKEYREAILDGEPLQTLTRLKNGAVIRALPASDAQVKGKHDPIFIADESCTDQVEKDEIFKVALQGTLSVPDFKIVFVSTFYYPEGYFSEIYDQARELQFKHYSWSALDAAKPCQLGMEYATKDDPYAIESYCMKNCILTEVREKLDEFLEPTGETEVWGCGGKARFSEGFIEPKNIVQARILNQGTDEFEIHWLAERPSVARTIYPSKVIDARLFDLDNLDYYLSESSPAKNEIKIGIDWGFDQPTAVVIGIKTHDKVYVAYAKQFKGITEKYIIRDFESFLDNYLLDGELEIFADAAGAFQNANLAESGYPVQPIHFGKWKDYGISNIQRYLASGRLLIGDEFTDLTKSLKGYRRGKTGKPVKHNDHFCDALSCLMLGWDFISTWGDQIVGPDGVNSTASGRPEGVAGTDNVWLI